ncbi:MAG: hypothetical protein HYW65_04870 [Candidatus Liptonbacteria bacterium]|nr:hypothetical protein [Candidatus Liptonbacteria bacterium]
MFDNPHKNSAIRLRKSGLTYSEILAKIPVAKSTLSLWLREVKLARQQVQRITEKKLLAMQRGWEKVHQNRVEKTLKIKEAARGKVSKLIKNPLWLIGTMLYWAEGAKQKEWRPSEKVAFSNMDVEMHRIFLRWIRKYLTTEQEPVYEMYIHENADSEKARSFWAENLGIPREKIRIYFKRHKMGHVRKRINEGYNGLLRVQIRKSANFRVKGTFVLVF